jgi:hypothetical protein
MRPECYRVRVPEHVRLAGFTAAGQRAPVMPGEYVVHRVRPKVPNTGLVDTLRFVGADPRGCDVHVPLTAGGDLEELLSAAEALAS